MAATSTTARLENRGRLIEQADKEIMRGKPRERTADENLENNPERKDCSDRDVVSAASIIFNPFNFFECRFRHF